MARPHHLFAQASGWLTASAGLATGSLAAAAVAGVHMLETAQRGVICGASASGPGHCWACYAAPLLALAASAAWRKSILRPSLVHARAR